MAHLEEFLAAFLTFLALTALVAWVTTNPPATEKFASINVLGPTGNAATYFSGNESRVVDNRTTVSWTVQVDNHMGSSQLFLIYVLLANRTISGPDPSTNAVTDRSLTPIPLLQEYHALADNDTWSLPLQWQVANKTSSPSSVTIHAMMINGRSMSGLQISGSTLNPNANNFRLVIELWSYNIPSHGFVFSYVRNTALVSVFNQLWFTVRP